jgi:hypothetical protein
VYEPKECGIDDHKECEDGYRYINDMTGAKKPVPCDQPIPHWADCGYEDFTKFGQYVSINCNYIRQAKL